MLVSLPSRTQLINWVNNTTQGHIVKLQQLSDGIAFCQIFNSIYPNTINLLKLKRDTKNNIIQKQNNFKLLLNAINILGLPARINIFDLASGKVTSILELLQWFFREAKNPTHRIVNNERQNARITQPTIVRSYVGNIVPRQISLFKEKSQSSKQNRNVHLRKSLDLRRMPQSMSQIHNMDLKQNLIQNMQLQQQKPNSLNNQTRTILPDSQNDLKEKNMSKRSSNGSKAFKLGRKLTQDEFRQRCQEKKEQMKKQKQMQKTKDKNRPLQQCLNQALSFNRKGLQATLIRVTQNAVEKVPQFRAECEQIFNQQLNKKENIMNAISQKKSQSNSQNTSLICQKDSQKKEQFYSFKKDQKIQYPSLQENKPQQKKQQPTEKQKASLNPSKKDSSSDLDLMNFDQFNKHFNITESKKDTVKKQSSKPAAQNEKVVLPLVYPKHMKNQISLEKQKSNQMADAKVNANEQKEQKKQPILTVQNIFSGLNTTISVKTSNFSEKKLQAQQEKQSKKIQSATQNPQINNLQEKDLGFNIFIKHTQQSKDKNLQKSDNLDSKKPQNNQQGRRLAQSEHVGSKQEEVDENLWKKFVNVTQQPNWYP